MRRVLSTTKNKHQHQQRTWGRNRTHPGNESTSDYTTKSGLSADVAVERDAGGGEGGRGVGIELGVGLDMEQGMVDMGLGRAVVLRRVDLRCTVRRRLVL